VPYKDGRKRDLFVQHVEVVATTVRCPVLVHGEGGAAARRCNAIVKRTFHDLRQHAAEHYMKKDSWAAVSKLENPCGLCYTANSASGPDVSAKCSVAIDGSKMVVTCRYLDGVANPSVKKSAKHTESNPQSTDIVVKCPECKEYKWSYFFSKHWNEHHQRSKGDMPGPLETATAVSKMERGYFERGQKKLAKKRGKGKGKGGGGKKAKKAASKASSKKAAPAKDGSSSGARAAGAGAAGAGVAGAGAGKHD